jgi:ATP-dependent Clp protease protease subunit
MKDQYEHLGDFFTHGVCTKTRTIWFEVGEDNDTEGKSLDSLAKQLLVLESVDNAPITIYMRNDGGDVGAGLAIYDLIASSPCHITIVGVDSCSSMGSIILQAGDVRKLLPNSYIMIHEGTVSYPPSTKMSIDNWRKLNDYHDDRCYEIYLDKMREVDPSFTLKRLKTLLKCDTVLTAQRALELGLIDEIVEKRI